MEQKQTKKNNIVTISIRPKNSEQEEFEQFEESLEKLLKIYNVKTYSSLVKILVDAEIRRQGL